LPAPAVRRPDIGWRCAGKRGLAQGWMLLQKQERRLLRLQERGPKRTLLRIQEQPLSRTQARQPLRYEDRVRFRAQGLSRNQVLLGFEHRRRVRGPAQRSEC
jgi:hypothetical protein